MRLRTMAAIGIGYLVGRRAGEQRYEDIQRLYHDVVGSDTFAQVVQRGKETLGEGVRMVTGTTPAWVSGNGEEASSGDGPVEATEDVAEGEGEGEEAAEREDEGDEGTEGSETQAT